MNRQNLAINKQLSLNCPLPPRLSQYGPCFHPNFFTDPVMAAPAPGLAGSTTGAGAHPISKQPTMTKPKLAYLIHLKRFLRQV